MSPGLGIDKVFWENAFGVRLSFGIIANNVQAMESGLHIPHWDFVVNMRMAEALAQIDENVGIDDEVEEIFREKLEKRIKDTISTKIAKELSACSVDTYGHYLRVKGFSREEDIAVKNSHFVLEEGIRN